jgi:hypothetical protein
LQAFDLGASPTTLPGIVPEHLFLGFLGLTPASVTIPSTAFIEIVKHKPNSILQFSGTTATGFPGRLCRQASSPISCCCNDMLSLDLRLEGAPSVPKSCRNVPSTMLPKGL